MMHEEIVTYEVAKLAKEKGFNWMPSMYFHSGVERDLREVGVNGANPNKIPHSPHISCPTQTQLQRWLREEKGIYIETYIDWEDSIEYEMIRYSWRVATIYRVGNNDIGGYYKNESEVYFDTYELALEDALKYALEKLV